VQDAIEVWAKGGVVENRTAASKAYAQNQKNNYRFGSRS
jgi:hypothetical protein